MGGNGWEGWMGEVNRQFFDPKRPFVIIFVSFLTVVPKKCRPRMRHVAKCPYQGWAQIKNFVFKSNHANEGIFQYLSPLTQLHGWWHLFAGYATYLHIINCIQQRLHFLKIDYSFRPSFFVGVNLELHPVQRLKLLKLKYYQD